MKTWGGFVVASPQTSHFPEPVVRPETTFGAVTGGLASPAGDGGASGGVGRERKPKNRLKKFITTAAAPKLARGSPKRGNGLSVLNSWVARRAQFFVPPHL